MPQRIVIYVPGLGDRRRGLILMQRLLLHTWRFYGFRSCLFTMGWSSASAFDERFGELLELIDKLHDDGYVVSLVGASAGASTAIAAFERRLDKVAGVVSICGLLRGVKAVHPRVLAANPRFEQSLLSMEHAFSRLGTDAYRRILTLRPQQDAVVPPGEATLPYATNYLMPVRGHFVGIGFGLGGEGRRITRFLRHIQASTGISG